VEAICDICFEDILLHREASASPASSPTSAARARATRRSSTPRPSSSASRRPSPSSCPRPNPASIATRDHVD